MSTLHVRLERGQATLLFLSSRRVPVTTLVFVLSFSIIDVFVLREVAWLISVFCDYQGGDSGLVAFVIFLDHLPLGFSLKLHVSLLVNLSSDMKIDIVKKILRRQL